MTSGATADASESTRGGTNGQADDVLHVAQRRVGKPDLDSDASPAGSGRQIEPAVSVHVCERRRSAVQHGEMELAFRCERATAVQEHGDGLLVGVETWIPGAVEAGDVELAVPFRSAGSAVRVLTHRIVVPRAERPVACG